MTTAPPAAGEHSGRRGKGKQCIGRRRGPDGGRRRGAAGVKVGRRSGWSGSEKLRPQSGRGRGWPAAPLDRTLQRTEYVVRCRTDSRQSAPQPKLSVSKTSAVAQRFRLLAHARSSDGHRMVIDNCQQPRYHRFVIQNFRHKGLRRLFANDEPQGIRADLLEKVENILAVLNRARVPADMDLPGFRLHRLKGDRKGFWSVTVRANWRVTFRFENGEAYDVDLVDYH